MPIRLEFILKKSNGSGRSAPFCHGLLTEVIGFAGFGGSGAGVAASVVCGL